MVYHGPSRGCRTCRLRRIKCDQGQPTCQRCKAAKRACLGYGASSVPYQLPGLAKKSTTISHGQRPTMESENEDVFRYLSEVVSAGMHSLHASSQTFEERRVLHRRYQSALRALRVAMASSSTSQHITSSAHALALYEMIVNLDPEDRTWLVHYDGFLASMRQTLDAQSGLQKGALWHISTLHTLEGQDQAITLSQSLKLRLRHLACEFEALCSSKNAPRKLDIQKIQADLRQVRRDLPLLANILCSSNRDVGSERSIQLEMWAMNLILASLLMDCGVRVHGNEQYALSREFGNLSDLGKESTEGIRALLASGLEAMCAEEIVPVQYMDARFGIPTNALQMLWPLAVVSTAREAEETTQRWSRNALWRIGEVARIPKAFHLAKTSRSEPRSSDALAGMIIIAFAQESRHNGLPT